MTMADFTTAPPALPVLDPEQRVNYSLGLVLGVGEFEQEQFYHLERARQHTRLLHGYGTACGLQVTANGSQVFVSPGVAVDPRGRVIDVPRAQCADLNQWLSDPANLASITPFGSPVGPATVYVVLCYRECLTNQVPVPGAPCRSEADTLAPSRITETFDLRFSVTRPAATEEVAVQHFGDLLARVQITTASTGATLLQVDEMEQLVRELAVGASPLGSPLGSPAEPLLLDPRDAASVLRAAFRVWITEVRPTLLTTGCGTPDEDCILLAQLDFNIARAGVVDPVPPPPIRVQQQERPFLLPTRLLQEWMFEAPSEAELALGAAPSASVSLLMPTLSGDVAGPPQLNTVQKIRNLIVDPTPPQLNDVLTGISVGGQVRWGPGPYTVQAAGHIPILAAPPSLTFGNLSAATQLTPPINGRVLLTFDGFSPAAQYVVKALPDLQGVNQTNPPTIPVVEYVGTNVAPPGLLLTVFDSRQGTPVPDTVLSSMHLMVEISQFARRVQP